MMSFSKIQMCTLCIFCLFMISTGLVIDGAHFKKSQFCLSSNSTNVTAPRFLSCATECSNNPECRAFGFTAQSKNCRISNLVGISLDECNEGEEIYDTKDCSSNPCASTGNCDDQVNGFICICDSGYDGTLCNNNINDCSPNPCSHGSCTDGVDSFTCTCDAGYAGNTCGIDTDECSSNPCASTGACDDQVNGFICNCDSGYDGTLCNDNINDCSPNPCLHGSCADGVDSFTCSCDAGYEGNTCGIDTNECSSNPCASTGTCDDQADGFICICDSGYDGALCNDKIDYCSPNPCLHGSCTDGVDSFTCSCDEGYDGETCACPDGYILNPVSYTCITKVARPMAIWQNAKETCEKSGDTLAVFPTLGDLQWLDNCQDFDFDWTTLWFGLKKINDTYRWQGRISTSVSLTSELWYTDDLHNLSSPDAVICVCACRRCRLRNDSCTKYRNFVCERQV